MSVVIWRIPQASTLTSSLLWSALVFRPLCPSFWTAKSPHTTLRKTNSCLSKSSPLAHAKVSSWVTSRYDDVCECDDMYVGDDVCVCVLCRSGDVGESSNVGILLNFFCQFSTLFRSKCVSLHLICCISMERLWSMKIYEPAVTPSDLPLLVRISIYFNEIRILMRFWYMQRCPLNSTSQRHLVCEFSFSVFFQILLEIIFLWISWFSWFFDRNGQCGGSQRVLRPIH